MTHDTIPAIEQTAGIGHGSTWFYIVSLILLVGIAVLFRIVGAHPKATPPPTPAPRRPLRCDAASGRNKCPANAQRIVMLINSSEGRAVCDADAARMVRIGVALDLGPIVRPVR